MLIDAEAIGKEEFRECISQYQTVVFNYNLIDNRHYNRTSNMVKLFKNEVKRFTFIVVNKKVFYVLDSNPEFINIGTKNPVYSAPFSGEYFAPVTKDYLSYLNGGAPSVATHSVTANSTLTTQATPTFVVPATVPVKSDYNLRDPEQFSAYLQSCLQSIQQTLGTKNKEYSRGNNMMHNFDVGAKISGELPEEILDGFMLKHWISYRDMLQDLKAGKVASEAMVKEKFTDLLNYLILQQALFLSRHGTNA